MVFLILSVFHSSYRRISSVFICYGFRLIGEGKGEEEGSDS
jgi:hypothetical protein